MRNYRIKYIGGIGLESYETMKKAVDTVKKLRSRQDVIGICEYSGGKLQDTIPIGGLI